MRPCVASLETSEAYPTLMAGRARAACVPPAEMICSVSEAWPPSVGYLMLTKSLGGGTEVLTEQYPGAMLTQLRCAPHRGAALRAARCQSWAALHVQAAAHDACKSTRPLASRLLH